MRLRAHVRRSTGRTVHTLGTLVDGQPVPTERLPLPRWLEITEGDGGYCLLHFDANGNCFADTWHATLEAAKSQAEFEFGIKQDEWQDV